MLTLCGDAFEPVWTDFGYGYLSRRSFAIGAQPSIADISMMAYLSFPKQEAGYDISVSHPNVAAWLKRMAALPGWKSPYDLLPGKRLHCYVS